MFDCGFKFTLISSWKTAWSLFFQIFIVSTAATASYIFNEFIFSEFKCFKLCTLCVLCV